MENQTHLEGVVVSPLRRISSKLSLGRGGGHHPWEESCFSLAPGMESDPKFSWSLLNGEVTASQSAG